MKQHLTIIFFLLTGSLLEAQNWLPFYPADTCLLRSDTSEYFAHTVWFDSVSAGPETYWFTPSHEVSPDLWWLYTGLAYPFGGAMVLEDSGRVVLDDLRGRRILLLPAAGPGSQWLMDTAAAITASVSSVGWGSVMGQSDSIKTISLSNGDSLVLSRLYGLVSFPERLTTGIRLRMAGIPNRGIGEEVLDFWDIYDFQVGMELYYNYGHGSVGGATSTIARARVLEMSIIENTIFVKVLYKGKTETSTFFGSTVVPILEDTVEWFFIDQPDRVENALPNRLRCFESGFNFLSDNPLRWGNYVVVDESQIAPVQVSANSSRSVLPFDKGEYNGPGSLCLQNLVLSAIDTLPSTKFGITDYADFEQRFSRGLGQTVGKSSVIDFDYSAQLVGYITGQDTVGIIYSDQSLAVVGLEDEHLLDGLRVFPNPATEHLSLEAGNPGDLPATVRLTDLQGRTVLETPMSHPSIRIDLGSLASGLYFLEAESRQGKRLRMKVWVREK